MAAYALEWHPNEPIVASGGRDRQILLWNLDQYFNAQGKIPEEEKDYYNTGGTSRNKEESQGMITNGVGENGIGGSGSISRIQKSLQSYLTDSKRDTKYPRLEPFIKLQGHTGNIEDLAFKHDSTSCELVSVGVDR